jgi:uncharacterized membrane protein YhhN
MSDGALAAALLTGSGLLALLAAEVRDSRAGVWIAKPLASTGFVAFALLLGALGSGYGRVVLIGLVLCWLGDVLLIPRGARGAFLAGLISFLLGHVAFVFAFFLRGLEPAWLAGAALACALAAGLALRWLWPHVESGMRGPVAAYVVVISAMVIFAASATGAGASPVLLAGAVAFYVSDLAVARERFVHSAVANRLWGLPLYYGATLLLAWSVAL